MLVVLCEFMLHPGFVKENVSHTCQLITKHCLNSKEAKMLFIAATSQTLIYGPAASPHACPINTSLSLLIQSNWLPQCQNVHDIL